MGQEARMCPSPVAEPLLGTSPTPQHGEGNPVQPGASAWAHQHVSSLVFSLEQEAGEAVTCLIVKPVLNIFLVLIAD